MSEVTTLPVITIERHPDPAREKAERIVAQWIIELWVERPDWLVQMPIPKDTKRLVDLIAESLNE